MRLQPIFSAIPLGLALTAPAALAQQQLYHVSGLGLGDELGACVADAGDFNNDGFDDLIVGMPYSNPNGNDSGSARVISGKDGSTLMLTTGVSIGDRLGFSVAGAGDVDTDGWADVIIGAPGDDTVNGVDSGSVRIVSGRFVIPILTVNGAASADQFGYAVSKAGYVNGVGHPEVIVGAPYADGPAGIDCGSARVFTGIDGTTLYTHYGSNVDDHFGMAVGYVGNTDAGNYPDYIVGAPDANFFTDVDKGRAYVYNALGGVLRYTIPGGSEHARMGAAVAGAGDVNGDGYADVMVSEPQFNNMGQQNSGRVLVLSGLSGALIHQVIGPSQSHFGASIDGVGDIDGDGRGEFVVGAPDAHVQFVGNAGVAHLYSGANAAVLRRYFGRAVGDRFGASVSSAGLVNPDNRQDLIIGAPREDFAAPDSGAATVYLLGTGGPEAYCTAKINSWGCLPEIEGIGTSSLSVGSGMWIVARKILPNSSGMMLWSTSSAATPFAGGLRCIGSPMHRTFVQNSGNTGGATCGGGYQFLFSKTYMALFGMTPGMQVHSQFWSRDQGFAAPNNMGLTAGLRFTVLP